MWPVDLTAKLRDGSTLLLRPLQRGDKGDYLRMRQRNAQWLRPWDPTHPEGAPRTVSFEELRKEQRQLARRGSLLPWVLVVDGRLCGQLNLGNIVRRSFRSCTVGYWVSEDSAGRGIAPLAVATACDYALTAGGLHRIEINVRPENEASLSVVRRLGLREEGVRPRYLHIDGAWRDHLSFAVTSEEIGPGGLRARLARSYASS